MAGNSIAPEPNHQESREARLIHLISTLRTFMNEHDNNAYVLQYAKDFVASSGVKVVEEALELSNKSANKINELLDEMEKTPLCKDIMTRQRVKTRTSKPPTDGSDR